MTKFTTHDYSTSVRNTWFRVALHLLLALWLILTPFLLARGQQPEGSITLLDVTARPVSNTTLVTITADGPLNQAQTWQDQEGYHVVIPGGHPAERIKEGRGYRIRRSGSAVEVLLYTKAGASVQVNTDAKHINLSVAGQLESRDAVPTSDSNQSYSLPNYGNSTSAPPVSDSSPAVASSETREPAKEAAPADSGRQNTSEVPSTITVGEPQSRGGIFNSIFSWTGAAVVVVLAVIALFFTYRSRKDSGWEIEPDESTASDEKADSETVPGKAKESIAESVKGNRRNTKTEVKPPAPPPVSLYSAYRIGQEVRKLALGQPHRTEVMSSRASEDRRAIQTSLIKIVSATETSEEERVRARNALEVYGFVSRECAVLLSSSDPFDRTMAARTLGEIGSSAALPSLLEALHDSETIVRNQVISSIGELRLPSAIGALIDAVRNQSELPKGLVSRALATCSIESVELADGVAPSFSNDLVSDSGIFDFTQLGQTESPIEELPETIEDDGLNEALTKATSDSPEVRSEAVKTLAQFPVKSAIATLVSMAQQDQESMVRSLAVSSLGFIDHELVFPAVLIGMADESRDVRAAAARALSRLSFDRTAAYGTLVRVADDQTLRDVAQACIKAGIVSQNIDRLASRDRRQAYEAFCLISLLAKAGVTAPILEAIENHQNMGVRLSVIHLLASTGDDSVFEQLQQIAGNDELAEEIKIAALNEMYTIQQAGRREHERHNEAQLSRVNVSEEIAFGQTETDASEVSM